MKTTEINKAKKNTVEDSIVPINVEALEHNLDEAHDFHMSGDLKSACVLYNSIIESIPGCDEAWGQLGMIGAELGDVDNALLCLDKASRLMPENSHYHNVKGDLYQFLGQEDIAVSCYQKTLENNPKESYAVSQLTLLTGKNPIVAVAVEMAG